MTLGLTTLICIILSNRFSLFLIDLLYLLFPLLLHELKLWLSIDFLFLSFFYILFKRGFTFNFIILSYRVSWLYAEVKLLLFALWQLLTLFFRYFKTEDERSKSSIFVLFFLNEKLCFVFDVERADDSHDLSYCFDLLLEDERR